VAPVPGMARAAITNGVTWSRGQRRGYAYRAPAGSRHTQCRLRYGRRTASGQHADVWRRRVDHLGVTRARKYLAPHDGYGARARFEGDGTIFAVFSRLAEAVELCLSDEEDHETRRRLEPDEGYVWRAQVGGVGRGARYGFRVRGAWDPGAGARCKPAKLASRPVCSRRRRNREPRPLAPGR
jgi:hypothetical protein